MNEDGEEALEPTFVAAGSFHFQSPQSPTPSSMVSDAGGDVNPNLQSTSSAGLPPFNTFMDSEMASERLGFRQPDPFNQDHYVRLDTHAYNKGMSTGLLDSSDNFHPLIPQPQYRPWESESMDPATVTTSDVYAANMYEYLGAQIPSQLPSSGPQFSFPVDTNRTGIGGDTISLTILAPTNSPSLFNYPAINRSHPLVPVPTPPFHFLDDRSMQQFSSPTLSNAQYQQLGSPSINQDNFITHSQPSLKVTFLNESVTFVSQQPLQPIYHTSNHTMLERETAIKVEESSAAPLLRYALVSRKKRGRKRQAKTPLGATVVNNGVGRFSVEISGQVAANKRSLMQQQSIDAMGGNVSGGERPPSSGEDRENMPGEKQTKKKRKRCGECFGCRLKENCHHCFPCRNVKTHQVCRMRQCEKLAGKKVSAQTRRYYGRVEPKVKPNVSLMEVNAAPRNPSFT